MSKGNVNVQRKCHCKPDLHSSSFCKLSPLSLTNFIIFANYFKLVRISVKYFTFSHKIVIIILILVNSSLCSFMQTYNTTTIQVYSKPHFNKTLKNIAKNTIYNLKNYFQASTLVITVILNKRNVIFEFYNGKILKMPLKMLIY